MTTMFYSIGFIFLLFEAYRIINPKNMRIYQFIAAYKLAKRKSKELEIARQNIGFVMFLIFVLTPLVCIYMCWNFIGLFTQQWQLFGLLMLLSIMTALVPKTVKNELILKCDAIVSFLLILMILINYFN